MYCPKCGHQQATEETRFCSRCGIALGMATELITGGSGFLEREKRELAGIGFTIATVLMLFNFLLVFGIVTLPHVINPVFFWLWLSFVLITLLSGGIGLTQLIRGGFFKRLKDRELQLKLLKGEYERHPLPQPTAPNRELASGSLDYLSVTETTTRDLGEKKQS